MEIKHLIPGILAITFALSGTSCRDKNQMEQQIPSEDMIVRIAEIEIDSASLDAYIAILKEEAAASVQLEPGVICIHPMFQKENPAQIRLLEIYADKTAYEAHLKTPHFEKYKTSTLHMVKSLRLIDMEAIDAETMPLIFAKMNQAKFHQPSTHEKDPVP